MGILNYNSKEIAQNRAGVKEHFAHVMSTKLVLILMFLSAISIGGFVLGYPSHYFRVLLGVGLIMALQTTYVYLRSHFSALGFYRTDSWLSALDKVLMLIVIGYFIFVQDNITISRFIYGQLIALAVALIFVLVMLGNKFSLGVKFSLERSIELLRNALPFALVFIFITLYTRMDGVMLERLVDDSARSAGIYANAYRLLDAANILGYLFSMLLLPMFANKLSENQDVNPLVKDASGLLMALATIISMICWFYAEDIMMTIYPLMDSENVEVFRLLMVSFWFMSMSYIFGALILAQGEIKVLNYLLVAGIFVNLGLNLYFIPSETALGAAKATLITQSFVFFGQFLLAKTKFSLRYPASYIFKTVIFITLAFAVLYLFSQKLTILWFFEVLISGTILLIFSILLGFLRFNLAKRN